MLKYISIGSFYTLVWEPQALMTHSNVFKFLVVGPGPDHFLIDRLRSKSPFLVEKTKGEWNGRNWDCRFCWVYVHIIWYGIYFK